MDSRDLGQEQVSRGVIGDGEGIAIASITELELAFEVGALQFVGGQSARERRSGGAAARPGERGDEPVAMENGVDRTFGRHADVAGQPAYQQLTDLPCTPIRLLVLDRAPAWPPCTA